MHGMPLKLKVSFTQLQRANVREAMYQLFLSLGEAYAPVEAAPTTPVVIPSEPTKARAKRPRKAPVQMDYETFVAQLGEPSRRFLSLIEARGTLRASEALVALGLRQPRALGGIAGGLARWAPARGVELPYEAIEIEGERAWRWSNSVAPKEGGETMERSLQAAKAAPKAAARPEREAAPEPAAEPAPQPVAEEAPTPVAEPAPEPVIVEDLEGLLAALPNKSQRFMALLREHGSLPIARALSLLGLSRAHALNQVLTPIREMAPRFGVELAYETHSDHTGARTFGWPGAEIDEGPVHPSLRARSTEVKVELPRPDLPRREVPQKAEDAAAAGAVVARPAGRSPTGTVLPFKSKNKVGPGVRRRRRK